MVKKFLLFFILSLIFVFRIVNGLQAPWPVEQTLKQTLQLQWRKSNYTESFSKACLISNK